MHENLQYTHIFSRRCYQNRTKGINKKGKISQGDIPVYQFDVTDMEDCLVNVSISIDSGKLVLFNKDRDVAERVLTKDEANKKRERVFI